MNILQIRPVTAIAAAAATCALLGLAACATAPPTAQTMVVPPMGTVTTYHRVSSGSLGNFDGKVVWTLARSTWQGQSVISWGAPQASTALYETNGFGEVAILDGSGKLLVSYDPPIRYQWPMAVGQRWTSKHQFTNHAAGRTVPLSIDWAVESWGDVTVPAGTFKAYKLIWTNNLGETETRWVNPAEGLATIKRHVERVASHPQGVGVLDAELLSRVLAPR